MTRRLYKEETYMNQFKANIISCTTYNNHYALVLDQTCFYPEGGGQPSDKGCIGECEVIDVIEKEGQIFHITNQEVSPEIVTCKIDWARRYDFMQQHTGQHILSYCFLELFNGKTDSFHLSTNSVSIEIDIKDFDQNRCNIIENMANEVIFENLHVSSIMVNEEELKKLPLRKQPSVKDNIRIVKIGDIDYSPCGGTHVMNTGEVGIIKIVKWEKLKETYRFEFLCGKRALLDYRNKNIITQSLCARFSVKDHELDKSVERLINENKSLSKDNANIKKELLKFEAEELYNQCSIINNKKVIIEIFENRMVDELKIISADITNHKHTITLFGVINETVQLVFSRSDDIAIDMNSLLRTVLPIINGKGGGSPKTAQGGGSIPQNLNILMDEAYRKVLSYK